MQFRKVFVVFVCTLLAAVSLPAQKRSPASPTRATRPFGFSDSVTLKSGDAAAEVKRLPVLHSYSLTDIRRQSVLRFADRQIDLKPFLQNPRSIANVAARMQAAPNLVKLRTTGVNVSQIEQGIVIQSDLEYSFVGGVCIGGASPQSVEALGIHCPKRASVPADGASQFGRALPTDRTSASLVKANRAKYATYFKQQDSLIQQHIAKLRAALKDPNKKAQWISAIGQTKFDQIGALTDDQIRDNIASAGVQKVHETVFVPTAGMAKLTPAVLALGAQPSQPRTATAVAPLTQDSKQSLGPDIYLTGFTLGDDFEWSETFGFDIDPCALGLDVVSDGLASVVLSFLGDSGCPMHASITPQAGLSYGFGMRFPIQMNMQYERQITGKKASASVVLNFQPKNGTTDDFIKAGLPKEKLFNGQEFVAGIDVYAGVQWDLPILGTGSVSTKDLPFQTSLDLTQFLPAPFTGGHFTPPAPGQTLNTGPLTISAVDLFFDLVNFEVLQATLNPSVEVGIVSKGLSFELDDKKFIAKSGQNPTTHATTVTTSGKPWPLGVDPKDHSTDFLVTNPVYNLGLQVTPGLKLNLNVDLGVFSVPWDPFIAIPQLAIDIPSQGINFSCHDGTICTHEYQQSSQDKVVEITPAEVTKAIQAQGCEGPSSDTNAFFCRNDPAWTYCLQQSGHLAKGTSCELDTAEALNFSFSQLGCPAGLCNQVKMVDSFSFSECQGHAIPCKIPNLQRCTAIVSAEGMQAFGYQRCCPSGSYPTLKACSTGRKLGPGDIIPIPAKPPTPSSGVPQGGSKTKAPPPPPPTQQPGPPASHAPTHGTVILPSTPTRPAVSTPPPPSAKPATATPPVASKKSSTKPTTTTQKPQ
jgi:hypothetical protein